MRIGNSNKHIPTLVEMIKLASEGSLSGEAVTDKDLQAKSAILGHYILSDSQASRELDRLKSGRHAVDGGKDTNYLGMPSGKLPNHVAFSNESPYAIQGLAAAEGGTWTQTGENKWNYTPSKAQFDRDPGYMDRLMNYYEHEKGNGIDSITLPNGKVIK